MSQFVKSQFIYQTHVAILQVLNFDVFGIE